MTLKTKSTGEISQIHEKKNLKRKQHLRASTEFGPKKSQQENLKMFVHNFFIYFVFSHFTYYFFKVSILSKHIGNLPTSHHLQTTKISGKTAQ